jgi:hypothetical protein
MPPGRRLLYYPGILQDAQDISDQYFNALGFFGENAKFWAVALS